MTASVLVEPDELGRSLGRQPLTFRHTFAGHSALELEVVAAFAAGHPPDLVEHHLADLPLLLPRGDPERLDLPAEEVARTVRENNCWMILWEADRTPAYRELLDAALVPVRARNGRGPEVLHSRTNILVGSPEAVVPAHFDRQHNLLLQVTGRKQLTLGWFPDQREAQHQIEQNFGRHHLNATVLPPVSKTFDLAPGDGIYIPPYTFHWVRGAADVSVALTCVFETAHTRRATRVHACNVRLRHLGLSPRPPGGSDVVDAAKAAAIQQWWDLGGRLKWARGQVAGRLKGRA